MVEKEQKFDVNLAVKTLDKLNSNLNQIEIEDICIIMQEIYLFMIQLGKFMSLAFSDIREKVDILRDHMKNTKETCLQKQIQSEISLGIQMLNSENNKKFTKDPKYLKYESASRTNLRLMWLMDYLVIMFRMLHQEPNLSLQKVCSHSYKVALGIHHPLAVRIAAKAAWLLSPSRETLYAKFAGTKDYNEKQLFAQFSDISDKLEITKNYLWTFYKENKIDELP